MTPEIQALQKQIDELRFMLNMFVRPDKYLFQRDVSVISGKSLKTDTGSKIGLYGATPVIRPSTHGTTSDMTVVGGTAVTESNGFSGGNGITYYTIGDLVKHLKAVGIIAP